MRNAINSTISLNQLKKDARERAKRDGIKQTQALDLEAKRHGWHDFAHAKREISRRGSSTAQHAMTPDASPAQTVAAEEHPDEIISYVLIMCSDVYGCEEFEYDSEEGRDAGLKRLRAKIRELNDGVERSFSFREDRLGEENAEELESVYIVPDTKSDGGIKLATLEEMREMAKARGITVTEDTDQPGLWVWYVRGESGIIDGCPMSLPSEAAALVDVLRRCEE